MPTIRLLHQLRQGVGRFQRRHDPLQPCQVTEGPQRLVIGDALVSGQPAVLEVRVLGPNTRVVEAR